MYFRRIATTLAIVFIACAGPAVPTGASADVITYSTCTINDGKTIDDVLAAFENWRTIAEKEGYGDYKIRILLPHAAQDASQATFAIEGSAPNFARYGAAFGWWYSDEDAAAANAVMNQAFTCGEQSVWRTAGAN